MGSEPPPFPKKRYHEHKHEMYAGKWPLAILSVITPRNEDSAGMTALKFGGLLISPVVVAPAALAGFAVDELKHSFPMGMPYAWLSGELEHEAYYDQQEVQDWCTALAKWTRDEIAAIEAARR